MGHAHGDPTIAFRHGRWTIGGGGPAKSMDDLQKCQSELRVLKDENRQLREAASAFGHLAERLNGQLQAERRTREIDRRTGPRSPADRRHPDEHTEGT